MPENKVEYIEYPLEIIIKYFEKGFTPKNISHIEHFIDVNKNIVIFKIFVKSS